MAATAGVIAVPLNPGEFHFGKEKLRLQTVLGSCVAITLWHPQRLIGGMCHYLLPSRHGPGSRPDGRYADGAMLLFRHEIDCHKTRPAEYQAKIFGGGHMFSRYGDWAHVGERNVEAARRLLTANGFRICLEDVGGFRARRLVFNLADGETCVKPTAPV